MKRTLTLLAVALSLQSAHAQTTYLTDDFSYNAGNLVGQGAWAQIGTVSTNPVQVADSNNMVPSTSLRFPGYSMLGGKAASVSTSGQNVYKNFTSVANSGSVYASFLLRVSAAQTGGNAFLALSSVPNTNNWLYGQVYAKSSGTGYVLGLVKYRQAQPLYSTTTLDFNTTYLIVLKYNIKPGALNNDSASLYAFTSAPPSVEANATPLIPPVGYASPLSDADSLTSLSIRQANATSSPNVQLDAFRVSSSWMGGTPLPASVLSFTALARNDAATVSWTTGSEQDVAAFEVEKSNDGASYTWMCTVAPRNAVGGASYTATDASLTAGIRYYRLKTTDLDGSSRYSAVATVRGAETVPAPLSLYPNPVHDEKAILTHPAAGTAWVWVMDATGTVVRSAAPTPGSTQTPLPLDGLPAGIYHAVYQDGPLRRSLPVWKN